MPQSIPSGWDLMTDQQKRDWVDEDRRWKRKQRLPIAIMAILAISTIGGIMAVGIHAEMEAENRIAPNLPSDAVICLSGPWSGGVEVHIDSQVVVYCRRNVK